MTRDDAVRWLRRVKLRMASRGAFSQSLVPIVEVCEFTLSHGLREVVERSRLRLRRSRPPTSTSGSASGPRRRRVSSRPQPDAPGGHRILVIDRTVPQGEEDAGSVRMFALLQILVELGHRVTFLPDDLTGFEAYAPSLQQLGIDVLHGPVDFATVAGGRDQFDTVILCRTPVAAKYLSPLAALRPRPFIVFDTVDLHHLREQRLADLENDPGLSRSASRTREHELGVMRASNMVWVTSSYEAELLGPDASLPPVQVVPLIQTVRTVVPGFAARRDMLFIGAFHHLPNEDAALYFVKEILPLVKVTLPDVRLNIVGSHTPPSISRLAAADVIVRGFVPDVQPLFEGCRVSVAPLRFGAGVKGKVAQSLAWGLPAVATPVAAEGMNLIDGEHVLIAADARQFAAGVIRLYRDETMWQRLSEGGQRHVQAHFDYASVRSSLDSMLRRLASHD